MKIITVGEERYTIHYSINSLVLMEKETGKTFTSMLGGEDGLSINSLRNIAFYGLTSKQRSIKPHEVGNLIDTLIEEGQSLTEITQMFIEELTSALGIDTTDEEVDEDASPNE